MCQASTTVKTVNWAGPRFTVNLRFITGTTRNGPERLQNAPKRCPSKQLFPQNDLLAAYDLWRGCYGTQEGPYGASFGVPA